MIIQVDGSCVNNGGENLPVMAGYAWVVLDQGRNECQHKAKKLSKGLYPATETRCEMAGLICALEWLKSNPTVTACIESDSKSTVDGILGKAKRKQNRDLWEPIERLIPELTDRIESIQFIKREYNSLADGYAREVAHALFVNGD